MESWLALGQSITDAGGWAAFFGLVSLIGIGLWRGWWVPGFWYKERDADVKELRKALADQTAAELERERRRRRGDA